MGFIVTDDFQIYILRSTSSLSSRITYQAPLLGIKSKCHFPRGSLWDLGGVHLGPVSVTSEDEGGSPGRREWLSCWCSYSRALSWWRWELWSWDGSSESFQLRQEICTVAWASHRCRLPGPRRATTLGKAASSYREWLLERTQLWLLSSQWSWQLGNEGLTWMGDLGSTASVMTTQDLVASHTHHFASLMQLSFFSKCLLCVLLIGLLVHPY